MAGVLRMSNSPTLLANESTVEEYAGVFRLPPKSTLEEMVESDLPVISGFEFNTGILSTVQHSWTAIVYPNQISVEINLQQRDNHNRNCYTLKPSSLDLISQGQVKARHEMVFQPTVGSALSPTMLWCASWVNDGSWDETVDTVRVSYKVCRELVSCVERANYMACFPITYPPDVTLVCEGESFETYKLLICNWSPVFKYMLSYHMEAEQVTVTIDNFEPQVISQFVKFMHSAELELMEESLCNSLLEVANFYQVETLRMLCERQLIEKKVNGKLHELFSKLGPKVL